MIYLSSRLEENMREGKKLRIILTLALGALSLAACGTLEVNIEPTDGLANEPAQTTMAPEASIATPTREKIQTPTVTPETIETLTPEPVKTSLWREVRDPGTGFGFALPCWWVTYMPSADALTYAITVASYDENYFMANSVKGQWLGGKPPNGAYKLDFLIDKQIDATLSDEAVVRQALTSDLNAVDLVQERPVGTHSALLAIQSNRDNPSSTGTVYAFRLSPSSLLMVSAVSDSELTDPIIKAMLNSLALSPDEPVQLPTIDPGPALIATPAACQP
jgi:hypothetical protein